MAYALEDAVASSPSHARGEDECHHAQCRYQVQRQELVRSHPPGPVLLRLRQKAAELSDKQHVCYSGHDTIVDDSRECVDRVMGSSVHNLVDVGCNTGC